MSWSKFNRMMCAPWLAFQSIGTVSTETLRSFRHLNSTSLKLVPPPQVSTPDGEVTPRADRTAREVGGLASVMSACPDALSLAIQKCVVFAA